MYDSLYIGNQDGGIISTITQAPQSGEPVVIIGLGGTGVDAIARLKRKLKKQIIPDNVDEVKAKGVEPEYDHIRFLGIDSDDKWLGRAGLCKEESLSIQNKIFNAMFKPEKLPALKKKKELQWMSIDYVAKNLPKDSDGAGGLRQFGRWLTVEKASEIKQRIEDVIRQACMENEATDKLIVHIISGISGGMGAGSFVDICYMVKYILLEELNYTEAKTFGYFVLPDAIISKPEIFGDPTRTKSNKKNGIASLLEIEHLMNLKDSNEWFDQDYGAFQIHTQEQLVDMCHFVSATNMDGVQVKNAYQYALNVIGDYILAYVSQEMAANSNGSITMKGNLANINEHISNLQPDFGYSQNYHIIGSANAEVPISQMATYLASEIFKKFTIRDKMPDNIQIEQEFADYLQLSDARFKQLENKVSQKASWTPVAETLVKQYFDELKAHMNDNILPKALINPTEQSLRQRKAKLLENREHLEKGVDDYRAEAGASSIPGMALGKLIEMAEDSKKGPIYAYGMLNKTGADIFHYLDARLKYYKSQKEHARDQEAAFDAMEPAAKRALGKAGFFDKAKRIREYTAVLNNSYHWQAEGDKYEEMEKLMTDLLAEFRKINQEYLRPLYRTTMELIETFQANSTYFAMGKGDESLDGFTKQLVKFSNIQPELDDEIRRLDAQAETTGMLKILTENPEIWRRKDETKLKTAISEYILNKFQAILSGSIESFLKKGLKMVGAPDAAFIRAIQKQIIEPFVKKATPIYWTSEDMVSKETKTTHTSNLTVPNSADCICEAADNYKGGDPKISVRKSLISDRIYILKTISGIPMYTYHGLVNYREAYEQYNGKGLHMYEQVPNWREILTFPYPYSYVPKYTKNAEELIQIYEEAVEKEIIYFTGNNRTEAYVRQYAELSAEDTDLQTLRVNGKLDYEAADARIEKLRMILEDEKEPIAINSKGNRSDNEIVLDNFLRFYGIQEAVKAELRKYDLIQETIAAIEVLKKDVDKEESLRKVFFDTILVGGFEDDGFNIKYDHVQGGLQKTEILCANGMPYAGLSKYYQAFQNMLKLDNMILTELKETTNAAFNAMDPKDKKAAVEKLLAMYNLQLCTTISNSYVGKPVKKDIDNFYNEFNEYLNQLLMLLMMAGAL